MRLPFIIAAITASIMAAAAVFFGIRRILCNMVDKRIERFQSDLIEKQVRETEDMYRRVSGWRHDYRNHIQNMKILLAQRNYEKLDSYMDELANDLITVDTVIKTGNIMADAVLNTKLSVAKKLNIRINVKANIPRDIPMSDVELCVVLGNLLDNAMESCGRLPEEERFMRIYIGIIKGQFYMSVQNSAGKIKRTNNGYLSTKRGGITYGYGIFSIDRIAGKYCGCVNRQNEQGVFATELMFPIVESA